MCRYLSDTCHAVFNDKSHFHTSLLCPNWISTEARERLESWCGCKYSGVTGWDEKINIALLNLGVLVSSSSGGKVTVYSL